MDENKSLSKRSKLEEFFMPLGMIGVVAYMIHIILGNILWHEYNPITTDISSLTADGAPNSSLLRIFTTIYGICMILFTLGMIVKSLKKYHLATRVGYTILLGMEVISLFGYSALPLVGDKTVMNFQNMMHIAVTVAVVITTISSAFTLAYGYLSQEKMKNLGKFILIMAIIITTIIIMMIITITTIIIYMMIVKRITMTIQLL